MECVMLQTQLVSLQYTLVRPSLFLCIFLFNVVDFVEYKIVFFRDALNLINFCFGWSHFEKSKYKFVCGHTSI